MQAACVALHSGFDSIGQRLLEAAGAPRDRGRKLEASVGAPGALWSPRLAHYQLPLVPGKVRVSPSVFPAQWKVKPQRKKHQGAGMEGAWAPGDGKELCSVKQSGQPH